MTPEFVKALIVTWVLVGIVGVCFGILIAAMTEDWSNNRDD